MEFVEGETLEKLIRRSGRLEIKSTLEIAWQVATGLAAVHKQKLVHRDIKPSNIMASPEEGGTVAAKIIDLGLAKPVNEPGSQTAISMPGGFAGTPEFASPEQFAGVGVDIRSDLYSLGVTLWEMVSGHVMFRGSPAEVMYQHQHAPLPLERLKDVPQPVVVLLEALLEKDPARRFQNPTELLKAIPTVRDALDTGRRVTRESLRKMPSIASRLGTRKSPVKLGPKKISVSTLVHSPVQEVDAPVVSCLFHQSLSEWHLQEITSCHEVMAEAISLAKELNDMAALTNALFNSGILAHFERDVAQAGCSASDVIELSTRHNLPFWLAIGSILRGWVLSVSGESVEGLSWIEQGIKDYRAPGSTLGLPYFLALKAEALFAANRSSEALEAVEEAQAVAQKCEVRFWSAELQRLRAAFLAAMGAEETQIEPSFRAAIRIAKGQKSVSLGKRAEATYAEYRRQKAGWSGGRAVRLPL
jgi:hypothetical protein